MGRFYATGKLGPQRHLTPEGFLVCVGVPIARTGMYEYSSDEIGVRSPTGIVTVERSGAEVFDPVAMASFEGKPVTLDHPDDNVSPGSWRNLSVGTVQNVRRGQGDQSDLLLADLMVSDQGAIDKINAGLREVSCGYEAEFNDLGNGRGQQHHIIGNHVALVARGRAGSRCAVGDTQTGGRGMDLERVKATVLTALGLESESTIDETGGNEMQKKDEAGTATNEERLAALEGAVNKLIEVVNGLAKKETPAADEDDPEEAKEETTDEEASENEEKETIDEDDPEEEKKGEIVGDKARKISDSVIARGEVLAPGLRPLVTDSAQGGPTRYMRRALTLAMADNAKAEAVKAFVGDKAVESLDVAEVKMAFVGASELIKDRNNTALLRSQMALRDANAKPLDMIAAINEANAKFYNKK